MGCGVVVDEKRAVVASRSEIVGGAAKVAVVPAAIDVVDDSVFG